MDLRNSGVTDSRFYDLQDFREQGARDSVLFEI